MTSISKIYQELNTAEVELAHITKWSKTAVIFGSARFSSEHKYYILAYSIAKHLVHKGYNIITGGGPGVMEAANMAAYEPESNVNSVGLNITLDMEQRPNEFQDVSLHYESLLSRKYGFFKNTDVYVVMPGGFGTMDELFEVLTLIQCGKIRRVPIVLVDRDYYLPLVVFLREMIKTGTISNEDLSLITVIDSADEIDEVLNGHI